MDDRKQYSFIKGTSPIVVAAIHDGHVVREEVLPFFKLNDEERLREEDPFTAEWVNISDNQIVVHHSRFETDVNRAREKAIYLKPKDAWGLHIWKENLPEEIIKKSYALYDAFYKKLKEYFDALYKIHDKLVVYDLHSYNHRREGENREANSRENPEINLGTQNMDISIWRPVIQKMTDVFTAFDYKGRQLDVRENIKFKGGYFGKWLYEQYGKKICPVSIEFKKFFMDEWTGKPFPEDIRLIRALLKSSIKPVINVLKKI